MSLALGSKALAEACEIKPPKSEAKRKLKDNDLVSFVPMEDLGVDQKFVEPKAERKLGEVAGSYTYFADGDVLLAKITPCFENGKLGIARDLTNGIGFGSSEYIVLRPKDGLSGEYLYYFLLQDSFRAEGEKRMSGAVGHKRVSKEYIERCQIPVPSPSEQQRIVAILDEASARLATATANAEKNLKNTRELFDSALNSIFERKGDEWITSTIGDAIESGLIFSPQDGNHGEIHPKKSDYVENGVPFIMASNLEDGEVNCADCNFISEETAAGLRKGFAKNGDVLLSHKGTIGRVAILNTDRPYVVLTPQVTYYRVRDADALSNRFIRFNFESAAFQSEMAHIAGAGSTRAYIGITKQLELTISYPPLAEQMKVASLLDYLKERSYDLENSYRQKLNSIAELKQSVLQKAFSGELTSPPPQAIKEAAE